MNAPATAMGSMDLATRYARLRAEIEAVVVGQGQALELAFIALLCGGHALFQGVPGVAKTLLVRSLAPALGLRFGRVQFTPDLMPSDIIGSADLPRRARASSASGPGPIFTDLLLADEINRAPAEDPGGDARGDAGARGHRRRHAPRARAVLHGVRHAEPDRAGGHLPAARGRARSLPVPDRGRLSGRGRRAAHARAAPRSGPAAEADRRRLQPRGARRAAGDRRARGRARRSARLRARAAPSHPRRRQPDGGRLAARRAVAAARGARRTPRCAGATTFCPKTSRRCCSRCSATAWWSSPRPRSTASAATTRWSRCCAACRCRIDLPDAPAGRAGCDRGAARVRVARAGVAGGTGLGRPSRSRSGSRSSMRAHPCARRRRSSSASCRSARVCANASPCATGSRSRAGARRPRCSTSCRPISAAITPRRRLAISEEPLAIERTVVPERRGVRALGPCSSTCARRSASTTAATASLPDRRCRVSGGRARRRARPAQPQAAR